MIEPVHWSVASGFLLFGQVQGWVLVIALLSKGPATSVSAGADSRWLAAFIASLAVTLNIPLLQELGLWWQWPHLLIVLSVIPLLFGPLLFTHVAILTHQRDFLRRPYFYWHLLLPVAGYLLILPLLGRDNAELQQILAAPSTETTRFSVMPVLKQLSFIFYSLSALFLLNRYERRLRNELADVSAFTLRWLRLLVYTSLALVALLTLVWFTGWSGDQHDLFLAVSVCVLIVSAAFHGLRSSPVFVSQLPLAEAQAASVAQIGPANVSGTTQFLPIRPLLEPDHLQRLQQQLEQLPSDEALLCDYSLSLDKLAKALKVSPHQLSWTLNQVRGQSFYDFVNSLRVQAVQQRLQDPSKSNQSILDIALCCGFSNKTTFNKAFKQHTGSTPSAWRREHIPKQLEDAFSAGDKRA